MVSLEGGDFAQCFLCPLLGMDASDPGSLDLGWLITVPELRTQVSLATNPHALASGEA
tara:strand:- start:401 stop:574 length:174 start_codon:yes stop_codon:yes gene_type:complete